jgi:hypothetical protein
MLSSQFPVHPFEILVLVFKMKGELLLEDVHWKILEHWMIDNIHFASFLQVNLVIKTHNSYLMTARCDRY